jgi:hypothetical protein
MTKVTCICCSAKKQIVTYSVLFLFLFLLFHGFFERVFWAFRNNGSSKTRKTKIEKVHLGSSQKMWVVVFFVRFFLFFFSLGCLVRFVLYRVFGRFVTRGGQKRD